jgi:hypothetical protein
VLHLVFSHRDQVAAVGENVHRHQHRVAEEAEIRRETPGELVLVAVGAVEVGQRHHRPEDPVQLGDLGMSLCRKRMAFLGSSPSARKAIAVSRVRVAAATGSRTVVRACRLAMK